MWRRDPFGQLYQLGAPCWAEIAVTDLRSSEEFYHAVLGWDFESGPAGFRYYHTAYADGAQVAAMARQQAGWSGGPVFWQLFLAARDIRESIAAIKEAGGRIVMDQLSVGSAGTMALATDPTGALFGLWDARLRHGFSAFKDHGTAATITHRSFDPDTAQRFYNDVFGDLESEPQQPITTRKDLHFEEYGPSSATIYPTHRPGLTAAWSLGFGVDDIAAACEAAIKLGGSLAPSSSRPEESELVTVLGPDGEAFDLLAVSPSDARQLNQATV